MNHPCLSLAPTPPTLTPPTQNGGLYAKHTHHVVSGTFAPPLHSHSRGLYDCRACVYTVGYATAAHVTGSGASTHHAAAVRGVFAAVRRSNRGRGCSRGNG